MQQYFRISSSVNSLGECLTGICRVGDWVQEPNQDGMGDISCNKGNEMFDAVDAECDGLGWFNGDDNPEHSECEAPLDTFSSILICSPSKFSSSSSRSTMLPLAAIGLLGLLKWVGVNFLNHFVSWFLFTSPFCSSIVLFCASPFSLLLDLFCPTFTLYVALTPCLDALFALCTYSLVVSTAFLRIPFMNFIRRQLLNPWNFWEYWSSFRTNDIFHRFSPIHPSQLICTIIYPVKGWALGLLLKWVIFEFLRLTCASTGVFCFTAWLPRFFVHAVSLPFFLGIVVITDISFCNLPSPYLDAALVLVAPGYWLM